MITKLEHFVQAIVFSALAADESGIDDACSKGSGTRVQDGIFLCERCLQLCLPTTPLPLPTSHGHREPFAMEIVSGNNESKETQTQCVCLFELPGYELEIAIGALTEIMENESRLNLSATVLLPHERALCIQILCPMVINCRSFLSIFVPRKVSPIWACLLKQLSSIAGSAESQIFGSLLSLREELTLQHFLDGATAAVSYSIMNASSVHKDESVFRSYHSGQSWEQSPSTPSVNSNKVHSHSFGSNWLLVAGSIIYHRFIADDTRDLTTATAVPLSCVSGVTHNPTVTAALQILLLRPLPGGLSFDANFIEICIQKLRERSFTCLVGALISFTIFDINPAAIGGHFLLIETVTQNVSAQYLLQMSVFLKPLWLQLIRVNEAAGNIFLLSVLIIQN